MENSSPMIEKLQVAAGRLPTFPCGLLASPLRWLPARLHGEGLALMLNRLFAEALEADELAFLDGRVLALRVSDLGIEYRLRLQGRRFLAAPGEGAEDLRFTGDTRTFLALATRREDPDTLFFQRRLRVEGDTEAGLALKNFLDALGDPPLPAPARRLLALLAEVHERYCVSRPS